MMKNVKFFILPSLVCLFLLSSFKTLKMCNNCDFNGGMSKVIFDKNVGSYKFAVMELGEFLYSVEFTNCKLIDGNKIELSGIVNSPVPKDGKLVSTVNNAPIFLCSEEDNYLVITDTITNTDINGNFTIKVKREDNSYIVIKQDEDIGISYALEEFK